MRIRNLSRSRFLALAISSVLVVGAGISVTAFRNASDSADGPAIALSEVEMRLPFQTLSDWATFSDHFVLATVVGERAIPPTQEETDAHEGFIPRMITIRVDKVLWSRADARPAPESFETQIDGWVFHGDKRSPMRSVGEPMMEVGKQFVLPILYWSKTETTAYAGWSLLGPISIFPYEDGLLGRGDSIPSIEARHGHRHDTTRQEFIGHPPSDWVAALAAAPLLPGTADAMDLPPDVRARQYWDATR